MSESGRNHNELAATNRQMALRFHPFPFQALNGQSVDTRLLGIPGVYQGMQRLADKVRFVKIDSVPTPDIKLLQELSPDWTLADVAACGICGTDRSVAKIKLPLKLVQEMSSRVEPFTLGHEIIVQIDGQKYAVYAPLNCHTRGAEPCPHCREGHENTCQRFGEKSVYEGLALGFGAKAHVGEKTIELPGGITEKIAVRENQLFPIGEMSLEKAAYIDDMSVSIHAINLARKKSLITGPHDSILIVGLGALGLTTLDYLFQSGYTDITVVAKHPAQKELVRYYQKMNPGIKLFDPNDRISGAYKTVFDCVGSDKNKKILSSITPLAVIALGDISFDETPKDQRNERGNHYTKMTPFWSTRQEFAEAVACLQNYPLPLEATRLTRLLPLSNAGDAIYHKNSSIKSIVVP